MIGDAVSVFITGLSKRNEVIIVLWAIFVIVNPKGGVDFFTWILNHAPTLTKPEKKRFQECLQQKEVNSHKGTGSTHDYALDIL